jgi:hypothetical protein
MDSNQKDIMAEVTILYDESEAEIVDGIWSACCSLKYLLTVMSLAVYSRYGDRQRRMDMKAICGWAVL